MIKPFYTSAAARDLTEILSFISHDKPSAALDWVEKIEAKCLLIACTPEIGELRPQFGKSVRASSMGRSQLYEAAVK